MITRPLLRYHGGKFLLAPWIIEHFPAHRTYVEPFGGAGSVLLQKQPCYSEVYNDLDEEIVNVFQMVRDRGDELENVLQLTPFSRREFQLSYQRASDNLERARRTIVRSFLGFGSAAASGKITGFRACADRSGSVPSHDWDNFPAALKGIILRMKRVIIENRPALQVMSQQDGPQVLHYLDPPYVLNTRHKLEKTKEYRYEMTNTQHEELCHFVQQLTGMVVISGYNSDMYTNLLKGWQVITKSTFADGAKRRQEVLYLSPSTWEKLQAERSQLEIQF